MSDVLSVAASPLKIHKLTLQFCFGSEDPARCSSTSDGLEWMRHGVAGGGATDGGGDAGQRRR
ncbi:hypothetical protein ABZP36_022359 [Zizania latifolia]